MARTKVVTIPARPEPGNRKIKRTNDPRYVDGQKVLVEAMKYLAKDPQANKDAVSLLSEHFRTQFRMSDRPQ